MLPKFRQCLIVIAVICLATTGLAETKAESGSVSDFLTDDGRFDLEAARQSGFEGSLNLDGFDVSLDPETGEPLLSPSGGASIEAVPDDQYWEDVTDPDYGLRTITCLTVYNGDLIAGGYFTSVGEDNHPMYYIARWDGSAWQSFSSGMNGWVQCLEVFDGLLFAGGRFTTAGGVPANYIARWTGALWLSLGTGVDWYVNAMTVFDGKLIVGGRFTTAGPLTVNNIASWTGTAWNHLGTGTNEPVRVLTVYDGELIAAGEFTIMGVTAVNYIARWNSVSWQALGSGLNSRVYSLTTYNGDLIVGGFFGMAGGSTADHIARWNGTTWSALGAGIDDDVYSLLVHNDTLIAGGYFSYGVAQWNGSSWEEMNLGIRHDDKVRALAAYNGDLICGGYVDDGPLRYDETARWQPLGTAVNAWVKALASTGNELIVGGTFTNAGGFDASRVASWDDNYSGGWDTLGSGLTNVVWSITNYNNEPVAGGGNQFIGYVSSWDGSTWQDIGTGFNKTVYCLTVFNGDLIAGGYFTTAEGSTANYIARWNGSSWQSLGTGMNGSVYCLTVFESELIAGGMFTTAGGTSANYIARWDGATWRTLSSGTNHWVMSLTVYDGDLIAGGFFTHAGLATANYIARWTGRNWYNLGTGMNGTVQSMTVFGGDLFAGGAFTQADIGVPAYHIARWDSSIWYPLGSGTNGNVLALAVFDNTLYVGGEFLTAGDKTAFRIARWAPDMDGDGYVSTDDCDDNDPFTYPGAAPNDHNVACMRDADEDDYGDILSSGVVLPGTDCNDAEATIYPGAPEVLDDGIDQDCNGTDAITCFVDADQDGYGTDAGTTVIAEDGSCDTGESESTKATDCNDAIASIYPGAPEVPDDGIDQDCNGADAITCFVDADHDGHGNDASTTVIAVDGSCDAPDGESDNNHDCNDAVASIYPGAPEIPDDGIDQDCNGTDAITCFVDADHDGYGNDAGTTVIAEDGLCNASQGESDNMNDCNDAVASIYPGAPETPDDGIDQDCNGTDAITCFVDADHDGYGTDFGTTVIAEDGSCDTQDGESDNMNDCDDFNSTMYPGAIEIWYDGMDRNCDGLNDFDQDSDGFVHEAYNPHAGGSAPGIGDCDDTEPLINPGAEEIPDDGIDQDCDGEDLVSSCCGQFTIGQTGNTNCDDEGKRNLADITRLIDRVYISKVELCCEANGNVNGDVEAKINLADITRLIDHVYIGKAETEACD